MRAVFDTNIFISAFVFPGKQAEAALLKAIDGDVQLLISKPIVQEILDVLARKFAREPEELARVAVYLADLAQFVQPRAKLSVLRDEPDNRILECAQAGHADVIVSGDKAMLALGDYQGIRILSLKEFLVLPVQ